MLCFCEEIRYRTYLLRKSAKTPAASCTLSSRRDFWDVSTQGISTTTRITQYKSCTYLNYCFVRQHNNSSNSLSVNFFVDFLFFRGFFPFFGLISNILQLRLPCLFFGFLFFLFCDFFFCGGQSKSLPSRSSRSNGGFWSGFSRSGIGIAGENNIAGGITDGRSMGSPTISDGSTGSIISGNCTLRFFRAPLIFSCFIFTRTESNRWQIVVTFSFGKSNYSSAIRFIITLFLAYSDCIPGTRESAARVDKRRASGMRNCRCG